MNKAILIGNLTRDPETRTTSSGIVKCTFSIACNRRFVDKTTGQREADFINIVTWRQTAELCARYLTKGRKVAVVGSIQSRSYDAQDGTKKYITEVVADEVEFIGTSGPGQAGASYDDMPSAPAEPSGFGAPAPKASGFSAPIDDDDELPF